MVTLPEVFSTPLGRATIGDQLRRHAQRIPTRNAIVAYGADGSRRAVTYLELNQQANGLAHALQSLGIGRGDVIGVMSSNCPETIISYYAGLKLGAAYTGINVMYGASEIQYQLEHAEPAAVVVAPSFVPLMESVRAAVPSTTRFIVLGGPADAPEGWHDWETLTAGRPQTEPEAEVDEHDVALISYTSGTEASPKGVVLPHRNYLVSTTPSYTWGLRITPEDVWLYVMPFYTIAGIGSVTSLTLIGATIVLPRSAEAGEALKVIQAERITVIAQTPTFFMALARHESFSSEAVASIERCLTYGGQISPFVTDSWGAAVPGLLWGTYWGQSELTQLGSVGWYRSIDDIPDKDPTWVGKPVHHLEVRVVDADGNDAEVGELLCRTPSVMLGYHKDPERTAEVVRDGWVHTGDIVRVDDEGNLFFYDRSKDVIKTGGMNVSSQEVERTLQTHPGVLRAAVVGVPDDYWSEVVTAFVIPKEGETLEAEELIAHCRASLAVFKAPKVVHLVDEFPTDPQGKVLKRELRKTPPVPAGAGA